MQPASSIRALQAAKPVNEFNGTDGRAVADKGRQPKTKNENYSV
jgi:hypothetical protein